MQAKDPEQREADRPSGPAAFRANVPERFVLQKLLGKGAYGAVYQAYDKARGATVAVKFLTAIDPAALFLFKSEFRALANLTHPNLVQLYELLTYADEWLLTMELVEGTDFQTYIYGPTLLEDGTAVETAVLNSDRIRRSRPSMEPVNVTAEALAAARTSPADLGRLRSVLAQLCEGLQALHAADRLHRDLKPANVLVASANGRVAICDFGLALEGIQPPAGSDHPASPAATHDSRFESRHSEIAGTLAFMSPEQAEAQTLTPASDWYSVGVMLYQALTGRVPFGRSLPYRAAVRMKQTQTPVHPNRIFPELARELSDLAMAMLDPDPARRAGYADVMRVLEAAPRRRSSRAPARSAFIGRAAQVAQLTQAFHTSRAGIPAIALVAGVSGMGKSALVRHVLAALENEHDALVLRARCYEREELPYKAFDPLVDALATHLVKLQPTRAAALLPESAEYLAALFPALRRVPALAARGDTPLAIGDPHERRRVAFQAFREMCKRLAAQRPLVLFIDDLQWGDLDSAPLFQELLNSPEAPGVLCVCAYRSEDAARSPLLSELRETLAFDAGSALRLIHVAVEALTLPEAKELARSMLTGQSGAERAAELIAAEAEGNPFFVRELAAYVAEHGIESASRIRLGAVIKAQLDTLAPAGRALLSLIAVAGRPVAHATLKAASPLGADSFKLLLELEARRFVSGTRVRDADCVECYHDRIRETACQLLPADETPRLHRALALALEQESEHDSDALFEHWRGAGERDKAAFYALRGAEKAEAALAFARAADLYREALGLLPSADPRRRGLEARLGHTLTLAGRGAEAAAIFLELIPGAAPAEGLNFRMLATTQLLRAGKLAAGLSALARADDLFGVRFPKSETKAVAMLLVRQAKIRWNDKKIAFRTDVRDDPRGARLDALWQVAAALSSADWLRGRIYGAELMLRAIEVGDPAHVASACGLEAVAAAAAYDAARTRRMLDLADEAAAAAGGDALLGRIRGIHAICGELEGRWRDSVRCARESHELHRRAAQLTWDFAIATWWEMASAAYAGMISELCARVPEALRDAETRGDVYAATSFRTYRCSWAWLGMDRPDVADQQVEIAEREWTPNGYQFQHWHMAYARSEIDLYRATPRRSLLRIERIWQPARLLRQVHAVHGDMLFSRARLLLAAAREDARPRSIARAAKDGRALVALNAPWTRALGQLVLGCAASFESPAEATERFAHAEAALGAAEMPLLAEIARVRRGQLTPGAEGDALIDAALEAIKRLGVKRPEGFVQMLAPCANAPRGRAL